MLFQQCCGLLCYLRRLLKATYFEDLNWLLKISKLETPTNLLQDLKMHKTFSKMQQFI